MIKDRPPYRLARKPLGVGGYAEVFLAEQRETGERVAFKRLRRALDNQEARARLRREIESLRRIDHPHVMPVLDHAADFAWYTMPLADEVLASLEPPIADELLSTIAREFASGLAAAHDAGLVHRDVTPPNIMRITRDGQARWVIADFGLVRRPRGMTTVVRTVGGGEFGTVGFAAPESWDDPHAMTAQADIYSVGRVAAWAVTGRRPVPNRPLLPDSGRWHAFVHRATQDDPSARPISMRALVALVDTNAPPVGPRATPSDATGNTFTYTVLSLRDVSTGAAKRYAAEVLVDGATGQEALRSIVRMVTGVLREEMYSRDKYSVASQPGRATDVVFLFVYFSLDDAANTNWRCRAQWVSPQLNAAFHPMPVRGDEWLDDIAVDWNEEQETRALLYRSETATKGEYLGEVNSITPQMEAFVTEADTLLEARDADQLTSDAYLEAMCRLEPSMSRLHNQIGRVGLPPTELRDLNTAFRAALGLAHNIALPFSERGLKMWPPPNRDYLVRAALRDTKRALTRLRFEREKARA